jgi:hypothetical protein
MVIRFAVVPPRASWPLPVWAAGLALLVALALMAALLIVLREAVQRGVTMRHDSVVQAESAWRCGNLQGRPSIDQCLVQRAATP